MYTGNLLLYFVEHGLLFSSNIAKKPNRNPEETNIEAPVKGPRDNFIEDISVNIALITKANTYKFIMCGKIRIRKTIKNDGRSSLF